MSDIAGMDWLSGAVHTLVHDSADKVAAPTLLRLSWLDVKGGTEWTDAERFEAHRLLTPYAAVLKLAGIGWRPAPSAPGNTGPCETVETRKAWAFDGRFLLRFQYGDEEARSAVSAIAGAKWNGAAYAVKASPAAADAIERLGAEFGFVVDEQAEALIHAVRAEEAARFQASKADTGTIEIEGLAGVLRPYQQAGVKYLSRVKKAFLADDMGLGKTAQALATVQNLGAWPALVVTLAAVKSCWKSECERWLPGVRVVTWEGRAGDTPSTAGDRVLHVVNYDVVADRLEELKALKINALILDEAHYCKSGKAKRTEAVRVLARRVPVRLALTGTPVLNRPAELLPQLQILGRLDDFGGFWHFVQRYCDAKQATHGRQATHWDMTGAANLQELHEKLRGVCYLRRTKEQVLTELPDQIVTRVPIGMSVDGARVYDQAAGDLLAWLAEKAACDDAWERSVAHLTEETREWERAERLNAAIERLDGMELLLRMQTLGEVAAQGKMAPAVPWIRELCAGQKLVLFGHHKSIVRDGLLKLVGPDLGAVVIDGNSTANVRAEAVRRFRNESGCRLLLANLTAGGTGLDGLQHAAHHVAFIEWPWTPASMQQAISRLHRMGQKSCVNVWHLVAPGTVDDERLAMLRAKEATTSALTDGIDRQSAAMAAARALAKWMVAK